MGETADEVNVECDLPSEARVEGRLKTMIREEENLDADAFRPSESAVQRGLVLNRMRNNYRESRLWISFGVHGYPAPKAFVKFRQGNLTRRGTALKNGPVVRLIERDRANRVSPRARLSRTSSCHEEPIRPEPMPDSGHTEQWDDPPLGVDPRNPRN